MYPPLPSNLSIDNIVLCQSPSQISLYNFCNSTQFAESVNPSNKLKIDLSNGSILSFLSLTKPNVVTKGGCGRVVEKGEKCPRMGEEVPPPYLTPDCGQIWGVLLLPIN